MSLDIAIIGADGSPKEQVSIDVYVHHRLMEFARERSANLLLRLQDYYGDTEFRSDELATLIGEANSLRERCADDEPLCSFLDAFTALAQRAQSQRKPLVALAD